MKVVVTPKDNVKITLSRADAVRLKTILCCTSELHFESRGYVASIGSELEHLSNALYTELFDGAHVMTL